MRHFLDRLRRARSGRPCPRRTLLCLEALEERFCPATVDEWTGAAGDNLASNARNWNLNQTPWALDPVHPLPAGFYPEYCSAHPNVTWDGADPVGGISCGDGYSGTWSASGGGYASCLGPMVVSGSPTHTTNMNIQAAVDGATNHGVVYMANNDNITVGDTGGDVTVLTLQSLNTDNTKTATFLSANSSNLSFLNVLGDATLKYLGSAGGNGSCNDYIRNTIVSTVAVNPPQTDGAAVLDGGYTGALNTYGSTLNVTALDANNKSWINAGTTTLQGEISLKLGGTYSQITASATTESHANVDGVVNQITPGGLYYFNATSGSQISFTGTSQYSTLRINSDNVDIAASVEERIQGGGAESDTLSINNVSNLGVSLANSSFAVSLDGTLGPTAGPWTIVSVRKGWTGANPTVLDPTGVTHTIAAGGAGLAGTIVMQRAGAAPTRLLPAPSAAPASALDVLYADPLWSWAGLADLLVAWESYPAAGQLV